MKSKKEEIMERISELATMDPIAQDEGIRQLAVEAGISITVLRKAVSRVARELREKGQEERARAREEIARAEEEAQRRLAEARARAEAAAAETTRAVWRRLTAEEPRLPAEPPPGMYLTANGMMLGWLKGPDGPILVETGPLAVPVREVPGAVVFLALDPWERWVEVTVPTSELSGERFAAALPIVAWWQIYLDFGSQQSARCGWPRAGRY